MMYQVRYKHCQGNGLGLCKTLKEARHDAKLLNGRIFNNKGKQLTAITSGEKHGT